MKINMVRFASLLTGIFIASALLVSERVSAAIVTWEFSGTVTRVFDAGGLLPGLIELNDPVSGTYTFNTNTADADPDPNSGRYIGSSFEFTIGALTFSDSSVVITVHNDVPFDGVIVDTFADLVAGGNAALEALPWQFKLELIEPPPASGLSNDSLPISPPDPLVFNAGTSFLVGGGGFININYIVDEISAEITPDMVMIDIKPGSFPNPINPASKGVIPVAILGTDSFDVADVNAETLMFGPNGAVPAHKVQAHFEDVNGDSKLDLVSHYRTRDTGIASGDMNACVSGETYADIPFQGCDAILTVP